jgi:hypothetical protein
MPCQPLQQQQEQQAVILTPPRASSLKSALEVVLSLVVKSGAEPTQLLSEYAAAWLPRGEVKQQLLGPHSPKAIQQLPMGKLVAVYEALEDVLLPAVLPSVHPDYRVDMSEETKVALLRFLGCSSGASTAVGQKQGRLPGAGVISPKVFAVVLGRFICRFLCSPAAYHPGTTPLKLYLTDERCTQWPVAGATGGT